ncbi:hypothetical protein VTN31DRAFT_2169 [Thermomyces dupontii]|uniref:uncharacterized protein n=1 Tax=Talaromyces thermophilus TaxID=28565 RepID=UPI003742C033
MAAADVRDMLDLPADGQPRPHKKQKVIEKRPEGITRELYALLGERAPPISLSETKYKGRPKWSKAKIRPWRMTEFTNEARSDGLVLRHWKRVTEPVDRRPPPDDTAMEIDGKPEEEIVKQSEPYPFAKYNIKAQVPRRYTDEEYNRHLKSDDWTREETDYLMDLVEEYDLRWVVIADRYDYKPQQTSENGQGEATALVPAKQYRTMEQLKARYYTVAATMLALEHPPSEMSEAEFELHEKMMKFDPVRESYRKELAAAQLNRTAEEVREEGILLEELKRIVSHEQSLTAERKELYARLDIPYHVGNTTMYQSSQGLSQLLQSLLQADKSKKRRSILGADAAASPAGATPSHNGPGGGRETPPASTATKKGAAAAQQQQQQQQQPAVKQLTPAEEARYGVQRHERLTAGVQFRGDRAQKLTQAKSNIQTQKLAAALTELGIPPRLVMPTERVCREFEKLVQQVHLLLDARKLNDKLQNEIRVLESARAERMRKEREAAAAANNVNNDNNNNSSAGGGDSGEGRTNPVVKVEIDNSAMQRESSDKQQQQRQQEEQQQQGQQSQTDKAAGAAG